MDGIELLKQVKCKYPEIRVLMITGHTGRYGSESVMDIGADGFISKPFKNIEITRTLRRLIDNI
jgi:DNA-binding NarL/FixJ family response regulator